MNTALKVLAMSSLASAVIREEERPSGSTSITIDTSHEDHTTHEDGSFKHPFE